MFSYYGSKSKVINAYPSPKHSKIIEPFAGSARYALKWFDRDVLLVDKYEVIVRVWHYLQRASKSDILKLPKKKPGETTDDFNFDCIEAKWLMGFMVQNGVNAPRKTVSSVGNFGASIERDKKRIANSLYKIQHWEIRQGSYADITNQSATWFIDPPYQFGGEYYRYGNTEIDYLSLAQWCNSRVGQVIVCENTKADWLPFWPMRELHGSKYKTTEAIWSNHRTGFEATQLDLFGNVAVTSL